MQSKQHERNLFWKQQIWIYIYGHKWCRLPAVNNTKCQMHRLALHGGEIIVILRKSVATCSPFMQSTEPNDGILPTAADGRWRGGRKLHQRKIIGACEEGHPYYLQYKAHLIWGPLSKPFGFSGLDTILDTIIDNGIQPESQKSGNHGAVSKKLKAITLFNQFKSIHGTTNYYIINHFSWQKLCACQLDITLWDI